MRFFNYSDTAPEKFKTNLESTSKKFDQSIGWQSYTPLTCTFLLGVLGAIQTGLTSSHPAFGILQIGIGLGGTFVVGVTTLVAKSAKSDGKKLIEDGVRDGFFKSEPPPIGNLEPEVRTQEDHSTEVDRHLSRMFNRPSFLGA